MQANWCKSENAGDQLTPWLIEKITGQKPDWVIPAWHHPHLVIAGSILNHAGQCATAWGAGIASAKDHIDPTVNIRAVRGPLTRKRALECGAKCPEVYGDPGLLVPRWVPRASRVTHEYGVVPHIVDYLDVKRRVGNGDIFKVVRLLDTIENVIHAITSCRYIVSSSLHGLVFAHAYNIPAAWAMFSTKLEGDGTKFRDYYASVLGEDFARLINPYANPDHQWEPEHFVRPLPEKLEEVTSKLWEARPDGLRTA